jgi:hypothetical protein
MVLAICAAVPLVLYARLAGSSQIDWISKPSVVSLWRALLDVSGTIPAIIGTLLIAGSGSLIVRLREKQLFALLAWLCIPPIAAFAISFAVKPIFAWRYLVEVGPAASLLIAGITMRVPLRLRSVLAVVLIAICVFEVHRTYALSHENWWEIRNILGAQAQSNESLVIYPASLNLSYRLARERELRLTRPLHVIYPTGSQPVWKFGGDDRPALTPSYPGSWLIAQNLYQSRVDLVFSQYYRRVLSRQVGDYIVIEHWIRK